MVDRELILEKRSKEMRRQNARADKTRNRQYMAPAESDDCSTCEFNNTCQKDVCPLYADNGGF